MDPYKKRQIGSTNVHVPVFGIGTAPLGGWPTAVPEEQALKTLQRAWDRGIRYFDTAPFYGHGLSEKRLGESLANVNRDKFVLSTKVGRILKSGDPDSSLFEGTPPLEPVFDFSAGGVKRSLTESRERLGFDQIDIALIHDPDEHFDEAISEAYPTLVELRDKGELSAIGVGMNWTEPLTKFAERGDFDCFLLAGRYTLLEQGPLDNLLPAVENQNASIIAGGVYNSGLLVDPQPGVTYNYEPAEANVIERAQGLQAVCQKYDVPLRAAALQFPLAHPAVASIVVGARTPEEVDDNLQMIQMEIPKDLWNDLKSAEMIREEAPVPD